MKSFILLTCLILWVGAYQVLAGEYVMEDMHVIEADEGMNIKRSTRDTPEEEQPKIRQGKQLLWGIPTNDISTFRQMFAGYYPTIRWADEREGYPGPVSTQPIMVQNTCYDAEGYTGECVSAYKKCATYKLYQLPYGLPTWALGSKNQCQGVEGYTSYDGVCCTGPESRQGKPPRRQFGGPFGGFGGRPGGFGPGGFGPGGRPGGPGGQFGRPGGFGPGGRPGGPGGQFGRPGGFGPGGQPQQPFQPPQGPQQPFQPPQGPPPQQPQPSQPESPKADEEEGPAVVVNPDDDQCGVQAFKTIKYNAEGEETEQAIREFGFPKKVAGGWPASKHEWPWVVQMLNGGRQFCDGSIIDKYHVLTAAHCVANMGANDVNSLRIRAGAHTFSADSHTQDVKVKLVVKNKLFSMKTLHSDIAILVLKEPFEYNDYVRPVCLPSGSQTYAGQKATVVGWGLLRENGPRPTSLMELTMEIWDNARCSSTYGSTAPAGIKDSMICAGQKGKDSCSGDSGGPFVIPNGDHWEQIGVVSWGIGCGKQHYPGVYTRVTSMLGWIEKVRGLYPN